MILRDPVHGLVSFETEEERLIPQLIDTPEVQRLRRVRQLGVTSMAFPGAEHTRFAHAIGSAFVMKLFLARLSLLEPALPAAQRLTRTHRQDALAAALLHDVGHGPLSHLFEHVVPGFPNHEVWTERILLDPETGVHRVLAAVDAAMPSRVAALVRGEHALPYLAKAVSGTFDVDRCDYLLRDAHSTGVLYGMFDLAWLLRSLCFAPQQEGEAAPQLAIDGAKGLPAIEAFLLGRLFMFQQVYLHKAPRAAAWMIRTALQRAVELAGAGEPPPQLPAAMAQGAQGGDVALGAYLDLDDAAIAGVLHAWESARDPLLADLTRRIRARALFKTLELFGEQATDAGRLEALSVAREVAQRAGFDPTVYVGLDVATDLPFRPDGERFPVVYAKGPSRPLREVSFLLGRLAGEPLTRVRLVCAPELRSGIVEGLGIA